MTSATHAHGLAVVSRRIHGVPTVVADGEIDLVTAPTLARHLATNLAGPPPPPLVLVDLRGVGFLSAAGLTVLAAAARRTDLRLIADTHLVVRVLSVSGLHEMLAVYTTQAAALAA